jgi:NADH:ubiquinone oxidoreductase subunit 6 (subunit J)
MSFDLTTIVLLIVLLAAGIWTVMVADLLLAAIGLAGVSAILAVILYHLGGPLAAVFELSVCAGLITVVFIATVSLTRAEDCEDARYERTKLLKRFVWLPVVLGIVGWALAASKIRVDQIAPPLTGAPEDVRHVLWSLRRYDLLGQILIILAGVFGVVVLFKSRNVDKEEDGK